MIFVIPVVVVVLAIIFYDLTQHYDMEKSLMVFKICSSFAEVLVLLHVLVWSVCLLLYYLPWFTSGDGVE